MLGNVKEFCGDWYASDAYKKLSRNDPRGPLQGKEYVVRGGSFQSDAEDIRISSRDHTRTKQWLMTDPQIPKSLWWYSDCADVGFRVVCELDSGFID